MKRMLINATQSEETRIALVDGQKLYDLDVETPGHQKKKANIYKGKVTRIEQHLEAAFIDYGSDRHGFLPFKEVAEEYFPTTHKEGKICISDVLKEGQEIVVQVQKEERGNKGAALTTQITLAGPYIVMMPNNPKAGGISRRIEGGDRSETRDALSDVDMPDGMGLIIRTAGVGKTTEELQWGINYLVQLWEAIGKSAKEQQAPFLIHQESDIVILAIRDYLRQDIGEIIIDNMEVFHKARDFIQHVMPEHVAKVKPYQDTIPLFTKFQVESQIETAYQREVTLPSGGVIVIDITEALTAIDINSSRSTKGGDIEETAFHTNMEAACEIARQLRLRDLGGLVVIDFIDMQSNRHQREIENKMRDAVKPDRARVQIGKISRFGLLEMSRQRLRPSIEEATQIVCPRCKGVGVIRGIESLALSILRLLEEESMKEATRRVTVQLPVDVATFLLNEKRPQITSLEDRNNMHILIVPNESMSTPQYKMERTRTSEEVTTDASYRNKSEMAIEQYTVAEPVAQKAKETPAVNTVQTQAPTPAPAPVAAAPAKPSLFARLWKAIFTSDEEKKEDAKKTSKRRPQRNPRGRNNRNDRNGRNNNRNDRNDRNGRNNNRNERNDRNGRNTSNRNNRNETTDNSVESNENTPENRNRNQRNNRNRNRPNNERTNEHSNKHSANNAPEQEAKKTETSNDSSAPAARPRKENGKEGGRPRQRNRNNTRNYNGRRRAPFNASEMSVNSPAPGTTPEAKPTQAPASTPAVSEETKQD